jgi:hypothetical protein
MHRQLDAGVKITASDGESRMIAAGEVLLVEDTIGKGHLRSTLRERFVVRFCAHRLDSWSASLGRGAPRPLEALAES